ncbi:hypothetical protein O181_030917 [Austropuccinia psidii MF-1]|uniref:Integrase zinc-binding domain-containing protein n=1 Tax=Austropuccinia psidii MF-1 TaxID=1389203 RepID=A0A9Q3H4V7_9BASI|nr:hypothetical protein [Austropuccinia psidii MF-1]
MKECGHVSLYISDFRSLVSGIGDWVERALIHHFRKGLPAKILHQLASHPSRIDPIQDLMDITLALDTRAPSFPSSVHIPSLNSNQSLLFSRDEVFKEIQAVAEDDSVASLNLFFGVEYLGYVVSSEGLNIYQEKFQQILNWPPPRNLKALQSFLVFANFYCRFIKNYSKRLSSLTTFLKKDSHFPLNDEALRQFHQLKEAFTIAPILSNFNSSLPTIILNCCRGCWGEFLSEFHFSIIYHPGQLAPLPDALSHWDNIYPDRGEDFISKNPMNYQNMIEKDEIQASKFFAVKVDSFSNLIDSIQKALWKDSQYRSIHQYLGKGKFVQDYSLDSSSQLLLFKDLVVVSNDPKIKLSILQKRNGSPLPGHPGQEKTLKLVKRDFYWSGMTQLIKDYVSSCQQCPRNKTIHHKNFGLLKPLPIPNCP